MNSNIERKKGIILSYVSIILNCVIQLLYTPLLVRKLGQSEYGLYSLVSSIIGYLTMLDLGFGNAIIVYTAKYRAKNLKKEEEKLHGMFKIIFISLGLFSMLLSLILFFTADKIFSATMTNVEIAKFKKMLLILAFNLLITFSFNIYNSIISAYEKFTYQKVMSIISTIIKPLIMIPLLCHGYKSITLCIIITIVNVAVLISNYIYCKRTLNVKVKYLGFDKKVLATVLGYSIWIFLGIIVDKINWSLDQFILGVVSGTTAVSIYSIASTINQLFINLSVAVSNVFLVKMSQMVSKKAYVEELTSEFIKIGRIQYYIIFFMCSCLILFGKELIFMWVGNDFEESYYVSLLLILPVCIPLIQNLGLSIIQALNKYKFKAISSIIMAIINGIVSIFLAKKLGAIGAALGTCISLIVCNVIVMNIYYYKKIKLNIALFWKNIAKMTFIFLIPLSIIIVIINIIKSQKAPMIIMYVIIYATIYFFISYKYVMNNYEKGLIKKTIFNRKE